MDRFEEHFWAGDETFTAIQALHQKVAQGHNEHQQVLTLCQEVMQVHENYAAAMRSIETKSNLLKLDAVGFGKDEGASLKQAFYLIQAECVKLAQENATFAAIIKENVVDSARVWLEESRQLFKSKKAEAEAKHKVIEKSKADVEKRKLAYEASCKHLETVQNTHEVRTGAALLFGPKTRRVSNAGSINENNLDILLTIGNSSMTSNKFNAIVHEMQKDLPLREFKYPLLGTYRCVSGDDIVKYLTQRWAEQLTTVDEATDFGNMMLERELISVVGRGNRFFGKDNWYYQWNKTDEELKAEKVEQAEKEMLEAESLYREAVEEVEALRMNYEAYLTDHLNFLQNMELSRIGGAKQALFTFSTAIGGVAAMMQNSSNTMLIGLETVSPEKDVCALGEKYRTGMIRPPPVLLQTKTSPVEDKLFGVDMRQHCIQFKCRTPWIVETILDILVTASESIPPEDRNIAWLQSLDVSVNDLFACRHELNTTKPSPKKELEEKYPIPVLIAVLRRYFMELPVPLLMYDEYDSFKTLYLSKPEDSEAMKRTDSVRELLTTLSPCHFYTLRLFAESFNKIFVTGEGKDISAPITYWGQIIMRPPQLFTGSFDRHQDRLLKDLILYCNEIFLNGNLKPADSESNFLSPIKADDDVSPLNDLINNLESQEDAPPPKPQIMKDDNDEVEVVLSDHPTLNKKASLEELKSVPLTPGQQTPDEVIPVDEVVKDQGHLDVESEEEKDFSTSPYAISPKEVKVENTNEFVAEEHEEELLTSQVVEDAEDGNLKEEEEEATLESEPVETKKVSQVDEDKDEEQFEEAQGPEEEAKSAISTGSIYSE